jgi:WD40 repeat protein
MEQLHAPQVGTAAQITPGLAQPTYDYDAFISYRRADGADLAQWLRRKLQDYRLPASLGQDRKPLQVYLDTTFERATEDFWTQNIEPAVRRSRFLIVILTPSVVQLGADGSQNWVERELELFMSLPQCRNIMVVRATGSQTDWLPRPLQQKHPRIDIVDLSTFRGRLMSPARRSYLNDKILTLIACLLGIPDIHMPVLRQEQERRRRQATARAVAALAILLALGSFLVWQLVRQHQIAQETALVAQQKEQEARDQLTARFVELGRQELSQGHTMRALPYLGAAYAMGKPSSQLRYMLAWAMQPVDAVLATLRPDGVHTRVRSVMFDPDGTRVLTASDDGTVEIWNLATGADPGRNFGHKIEEQVMAVSPDGTRLVTAGQKDGVVLWEIGGEHPVEPWSPEWIGDHDGAVSSVAFSQDGKHIVTTSSDGTAKIWDTNTHKLELTLPHHGDVLAAAFSQDGTLLVTAGADKTAKVWNAATGEMLHTLNHDGGVLAAALSRDGARVVTASDDETARIWDASTGQLLHTLRHDGRVVAALFSREGTRVVTASDDRSARIWDTADGKRLKTLLHSGPVVAAALSEDGTRLTTASGDQAEIWDAVTGDHRLTLAGHSADVVAVAFSRDGTKVVTASSDGTAKVWRATGSALLTVLDGQTGSARSASFSHDGRLVITGMANGTATICDAATGKVLHILPGPNDAGHKDHISSVEFSHDDKWIVTASGDKTAKIWDSATGALKSTLLHATGVFAAAFTLDDTVVTVDENKNIKTWDWAKGVVLFDWTEHGGEIVGTAFSPDGKWLVTIDRDGSAKVMDTAARAVSHAWKVLNGMALSTAFSANGEWVVTTDWNMTATVWKGASGEVQSVLHPAQRFPPLRGAVNPDGTLAVTAGLKLQIWGATTGSPLIALGDDGALTAGFNNDGTRLVSAGYNGARIWEVNLESRSPADVRKLIHDRVPWILNGEQLIQVK